MKRTVRFSPLLFVMMLLPLTLAYTCSGAAPNASLASIELEAGGLNRVVGFSGSTLDYNVWVPDDATTVTLRATAARTSAKVLYALLPGTPASEYLGIGGGERIVTIPMGQSSIRLDVSRNGELRSYTLNVNPSCNTGECDDASSCTTDVCDTNTSLCGFAEWADGTRA
jgi:hypothetical protein